MADFTSPQLDAFRTQYIRDKYVAANGSNPTVALSDYNRAKKAVFIDDATINAIKARIDNDYAEELNGVWVSKYNERIQAGDDSATATTAADDEKLQATYRICRAEVRDMMMEDAGFVGSISDETQRKVMFATWATANGRDRTFARTRSSAQFASVPLERF